MSRRRNTSRSTETLCRWCQAVPTRDDAFVCDEDLDAFAQALRDLLPASSDRLETMLGHVGWCAWPRQLEVEPGLWDDLQTYIAGERAIDYRTVGGPSGAVLDDRALEPGERRGAVSTGIDLPERGVQVSDAVVRSLRALVVVCRDARLEHNAPEGQALRSTRLVPAMAEWLLWRVDAIGFHPEAADAAFTVFDAVDAARWVIDRPTSRQQLGDCPVPGCPGHLSAAPGATFARCDVEGHAVEAQPVRDHYLAALDDRLCTAGEIARLSTYLGLDLDRMQVANRVRQWAHRDRIRVAAYDTPTDDRGRDVPPLSGPVCRLRGGGRGGTPACDHDSCPDVLASRGPALYRFGEVYAALLEHVTRNSFAEDDLDDETKGA